MEKRVIQCYRDGLTREETFQRLSSKNDLPFFDGDLVTKCFKDLDKKQGYPEGLEGNYFDLLFNVYQIFDKIQTTISVWPATLHGSFYYLDSRYTLVLGEINYQSTLHVLDTYHGQVR
jgi:hypothetical protein